MPGSDSGTSQGEPKSPMDSGVDASDCSIVDAGKEADADSGLDQYGDPIVVCDPPGTIIVGHCLTNMATLCIAYYTSHEVECETSGHQTSGWHPGDCGSDQGSALTRSNGGCVNECGLVQWNYRLGGFAPTDESRQAFKESCEAANRTYVPVP